jgi:hypothetical protein
MANRFLNNIRINDAYTFPASDGNDGQVITTDGAGNLAFENVSPDAASVIYRDNFTGDGSTVAFDLQNSITDEDQTQIYIDGVYQEKSTYSISGTTITFTTAPISGHSVEVISISSINTGPTVLYQDNFTGNGSTTAFTLGQAIDNEIKTFIFLNGVYQFKNTYTVDGTTLTFDAAPANGVAIEIVSIASAVQSDSLEAGAVIIPVKNTHTASIAKGTPVYISGNVGASERLQIAPADASNSAKMPSAGLLLTTLAVNAEGYAITGGYLRNITTDTIDGTSTASNDTVYVKAGGGLTMTKPTGTNLIQNIAKVARSASGSSGSLLVSSILRTNDIPNIANDHFWLGNSSSVATATSFPSEVGNYLTTNSYATESYVDTEVAGLVASAPTTLDTLNELAAALGDDPNFATTTATSIGLKAPIASPSFTGNAAFAGNVLIGAGTAPNKLTVKASNTGTQITTIPVGKFINTGNSFSKLIVGSDNANFDGVFSMDNNSTLADTKLRIYIGNGTNATTGHSNDHIVLQGNGNVGIGTDSPTHLLTLEKTDTNSVQLVIDNNNTSDAGTETSKIRFRHYRSYVAGLNDAAEITVGKEEAWDATSDRNSYMSFSTRTGAIGVTERMRIDSSGRVGINVTPSYANVPLHTKNIGGGDSFNIFEGIGNAWVFGEADQAGTKYCQVAGRYGHHSGINVDLGGNVGIGTTTPDEKLEVNGTIASIASSLPTFKVQGSDVNYQGRMRWDTNNNVLEFLTRHGGTYYSDTLVLKEGKVGIGTNSPGEKLHVEGRGTFDGGTSSDILQIRNDNGGGVFGMTSNLFSLDLASTSAFRIRQGSSVPFYLKSDGNVGIGTTSPSTKFQLNSPNAGAVVGGTIGATIYGYSNNEMLVISSRYDQNLGGIRFKRGQAGSEVDSGSITFTASGTSFNTSSDYRLKEDLQDFAGLDMVSKIPVYDFKWKTDKSRSYGVMAHELQEILPLAVTGEKDAEKMQGVDYSKIIPLLIKSIQELKADNDNLKARIETLENN